MFYAEVVGTAVGGPVVAKVGKEVLDTAVDAAKKRVADNIPESLVRPGMENRTDAEFKEIGQLKFEEVKAVEDIAKKHDCSVGVCGSLAETREGLENRANPDLRYALPAWRAEKPISSGTDVDLWVSPETSFVTKDAIVADVEKVFPDREVDVKYSDYYDTREELNDQAGSIIFEADGTRSRMLPPWAEPDFASKNLNNQPKDQLAPKVVVEAKVAEAWFKDTNQTARPSSQADAKKPTLIAKDVQVKVNKNPNKQYPNANMADAHAEIGVIQQAFDSGKTQGNNMVMKVEGESVCDYCRSDLRKAADKAGLKSLMVVEEKTGKVLTWVRREDGSMSKVKETLSDEDID